MSTNEKIAILSAAWGIGAPNIGCGDGPAIIKKSPYRSTLSPAIQLVWLNAIGCENALGCRNDMAILNALCTQLALQVETAVTNKQRFITIGGDHSCAIGTWSGAAHAVAKKGDCGLIWVDAHLDAHTPETTESGNLHGMPVACLLGEGDARLTHILNNKKKIKPENLCVIGVRSYEKGEQVLLERLGVKIFYQAEVVSLGLAEVMRQAIAIAKHGTSFYGISIDLDALDPQEIPAVGSPEPDGIHLPDLLDVLSRVREDPQWIGAEIAEFDPHLDQGKSTEKAMYDIITVLFQNK